MFFSDIKLGKFCAELSVTKHNRIALKIDDFLIMDLILIDEN